MTHPRGLVTIALLMLASTGGGVSGQTSGLLGFGPTFPVGTFTDSGPFAGANTGWQGMIGLQRAVGSSGLSLGARVFYGANSYEGSGEQDSSLLGITALGTWRLTDGPVFPILWSEAGFLSHEYSADSGGLLGGSVDSSESAFVFTGGVGVGVPVGSVSVLLLAGYSHAFGVFNDVRYFSLTAATSFSIG